MKLEDVLVDMSSGAKVTMRAGVTTTGNRVNLGGTTIFPTFWLNKPATSGIAVVVLIHNGLSLAIGATLNT